VHVGVEVGDVVGLAGRVDRHLVLERRLTLRVGRAAAAAVVGGRVLRAVAVDVHVDELPGLALEVDDVVVVEEVAAVGEVWGARNGALEEGEEDEEKKRRREGNNSPPLSPSVLWNPPASTLSHSPRSVMNFLKFLSVSGMSRAPAPAMSPVVAAAAASARAKRAMAVVGGWMGVVGSVSRRE
jgi:hypothetical protein